MKRSAMPLVQGRQGPGAQVVNGDARGAGRARRESCRSLARPRSQRAGISGTPRTASLHPRIGLASLFCDSDEKEGSSQPRPGRQTSRRSGRLFRVWVWTGVQVVRGIETPRRTCCGVRLALGEWPDPLRLALADDRDQGSPVDTHPAPARSGSPGAPTQFRMVIPNRPPEAHIQGSAGQAGA